MNNKIFAALALILLLCVFAYTQTTTKPAAGTKATAWEYNVVLTSVQTGKKDLNELGREGWELVSSNETTVGDNTYYVVFLKRPK